MFITLKLVVFLLCTYGSFCWPYMTRGKIGCAPQKTPHYGIKWCLFERHQSEVGSTCWFSCNEGYHLNGPEVTECVLNSAGDEAHFNDTIGYCKVNAPKLREGKNGPYLVHSYSPSSYVIHVGANNEVTLKSYYYLALYVQSPGVNGIENTVSFLVQGTVNKYIKTNGTTVYTEEVEKYSSDDMDSATFYLWNNKYFDGYAAFESYVKSDHFLFQKSRNIILSKVRDDEEEDYICASFTWSPDL